jgi:tetratricopeptide (TPR) repeat protein
MRTFHKAATAWLTLAAVLACPASAWARWTRFATGHFVFVGDAPERDMRTIAARLEQFREIVGRVFSEDMTHSPVPTVVVVFQNERSLAPYTPMFQGRPVSVAGYFVGMEDANYIAVNAERELDAYGAIFHEYAHFLTGSAVGAAPVWVNEGLAELYQTFEASNGGRSATIGAPDRENLKLLQAASTLLPVSELIAIEHDSPMYNEGDRRGLLYAESWALVHYLTFGAPARRGQLKRYLDTVGQATTSPADAFRDAFGPDMTALDRELQRYVRSSTFNVLKLEFNDRTANAASSPGRTISDTDAAGYLGDLMARLNRTDDARSYLKTAIAQNPDAALAMSALGLLELRAGNDELAFPLLEKAAALAPGDATVQSAFGRALTRRADRGAVDEDALYLKARVVLARAMEIDPNNVSTIVTLAEVEMGSGATPSRAVALMQRAIKASPGREEYRLMYAQALALNGDYPEARAQLGSLLSRTKQPTVREAARKTLEGIAKAENAVRDLAEASASGNSTPASRDGAAGAQSPEPPRETMVQGAYVPTLRSVQVGESRVTGVFSALDCRAGAVVLVIDSAEGPVRLAVKSLNDVEFLTYRQDSPASVSCGAQRPAFRVLATFRTDLPVAGANTPNRAVAVELLPDGYDPK